MAISTSPVDDAMIEFDGFGGAARKNPRWVARLALVACIPLLGPTLASAALLTRDNWNDGHVFVAVLRAAAQIGIVAACCRLVLIAKRRHRVTSKFWKLWGGMIILAVLLLVANLYEISTFPSG